MEKFIKGRDDAKLHQPYFVQKYGVLWKVYEWYYNPHDNCMQYSLDHIFDDEEKAKEHCRILNGEHEL